MLRFFWPLAVTSGVQAVSRPIINLFVARGADGTESLAVLTIVYALAHLPYGWLNELKNLPAAFQRQDPDGRFIRRFTAGCGLLSFVVMALMFWTPVRFFLLETLIGVDHEFAVRCTVPLIIFSFFPLAVTVRSYLHGVALRDHRTSAIAPSDPPAPALSSSWSTSLRCSTCTERSAAWPPCTPVSSRNLRSPLAHGEGSV